uniref:Uncharacterized protein n=1 Tax=Lactuca sativa TaxID=4236 RepID=A0A9R1XE67_LACSA|nr:hypothetical protein LSAT_V11C400203960 [Lactuca sativa]
MNVGNDGYGLYQESKNVFGTWPLWLSYLTEPIPLKWSFKSCFQTHITDYIEACKAYRESDLKKILARLRHAPFDDFRTWIYIIANQK